MPLNGESNGKCGVYKSVCCGAEIVINANSLFPDCANHPGALTIWRPAVNGQMIGLRERKSELGAAREAHIDNCHLFDLALGRLKLEEREQNHLHGCRVCQGVLYVLVHQPISATAGSAEKPAIVA